MPVKWRCKPVPREVQTVRKWLDTWDRSHRDETQRQDYDLQLTRFDARGWRATFFVTGMEHSLTNTTGTAWEPTPWRVVQVATWDALGKVPADRSRRHRPRM